MSTIIVIDIEMCLVRKEHQWEDYPYHHEIIQIGAVMMNESYERTGEFSSFVRPRYGRIDQAIRELTGIRETDTGAAPDLETVLKEMLSWIADSQPVFYSWSITDYKQIAREIRAKGMNEEEMALFLDAGNWVDYQVTAGKRFHKPWRMSLEDALMLAKIEPVGKQHDGLADAGNTARLIAKLEKEAQ